SKRKNFRRQTARPQTRRGRRISGGKQQSTNTSESERLGCVRRSAQAPRRRFVRLLNKDSAPANATGVGKRKEVGRWAAGRVVQVRAGGPKARSHGYARISSLRQRRAGGAGLDDRRRGGARERPPPHHQRQRHGVQAGGGVRPGA